jgi:hypothetical protein
VFDAMKFGLLAVDEEVIPLARAVVNSAKHELVAVCGGSASSALFADGVIPPEVHFESWETLLVPQSLDAVIIGSSPDPPEREQALRDLVRECVPLLVVHPACDYLQALELESLRRDVAGTIEPYYPERGHPALERLIGWVQTGGDSGGVGGLLELSVSRRMGHGDRECLMPQLTRDVGMIRRLLGSVHAVQVREAISENAARLVVQFDGPDGAGVRWTGETAAPATSSHLICVRRDGASARVELGGIDDESFFHCDPEHASREKFPPWDAGAFSLNEFCRQRLDGEAEDGWQEALLDLEIIDNAEQSLRSERRVEIVRRDMSEEASFKALMAVGACGVLSLVLFAVVGFAIYEGLRLGSAPPATVPDGAATSRPIGSLVGPLFLLVLLGAFLALQALLYVARRRNKPAKTRPPKMGKI